jgi:hypothetical protein
MSTSVLADDVLNLAATVQASIDALMPCSLTGLSQDELLAVVRQLETARRQLEAFDSVLIPELESRNLPGKFMMRSTSALLAGLLNLPTSEASARVRQAQHLGTRQTPTGQQLPPLLPATARARAAGAITTAHATVIIRTIGKLPTTVPVEEVTTAEAFLVEQAQILDSATLRGVARQLLDTLNPDGTLADDGWQRRHRYLTCTPSGDGMYRLNADLDSETATLAMAVLHSLAAPQPSENGDRDERSAGQRMHDAFRAVLKLALRAGELPRSGGVPATVLITMTAEQFESRTGLASTSFGQKITVDRALRIADQASVAWVVHDSVGGVLNYGTTQRLASGSQTLALIARDGGCTFPGCTAPPEWTERHHIVPWSQGGRTDLDNLCLLCDWHHDRIDSGGWRVIMQAGVPSFVPPAWLDPAQRPRRNQRPRPM